MAQRKRTKEQISYAEASRYHQRGMEARGETWNLKLILDGDGTEETIAILGSFKKRGYLKPEVRRRVIAAARAALLEHGTSQSAGEREIRDLFERGRQIIDRAKNSGRKRS